MLAEKFCTHLEEFHWKFQGGGDLKSDIIKRNHEVAVQLFRGLGTGVVFKIIKKALFEGCMYGYFLEQRVTGSIKMYM